jgi:fructokinase
MAGLLYGITRLYDGLPAFRTAGVGEIREMATFGCRIGARVVERLGAVEGLPRAAEAAALLPALLRAG